MSRGGNLTLAGLFVGSMTLGSFVFLYALTPLAPLLLALATAVSSKSRPFAWGALAAAVGATVFLVIAAAISSSVAPGIDHYYGS